MLLLNLGDWIRMLLLYGHLVLCAFAISAVLKTDCAIVFGKLTRKELESSAHIILVILIALWGTGLAIIYIDTGFNPEIMMTKSKLLLKLVCVVVLTLNGMVLHHISFPVLTNDTGKMTRTQSILLVTTGALSTSNWMLAVFIGLSKPLGQLPFQVLLSAYSVFTLWVIVTSLFFIPLLSNFSVDRESFPTIRL